MCGDMLNIGQELKKLELANCDLLHLDVMDGIFVENMGLFPEWIEKIKENTSIPLDIHLATKVPEIFLEMFIKTNPKYISFHIEATSNPKKIINRLREVGVKPSIAINPETPISKIEPYLKYVDMVLLMTVNSGFSGQLLKEETLLKLEELHNIIRNLQHKPLIEVDGNIHNETIEKMRSFLPDVFVLGTSALFHKKDSLNYQDRIQNIREKIQEISYSK